MLNVLRGATVAASMGLAARASWNSHCDKEVLSEDHIRDFHRIRDKCSKISSKDEAAANGMSWDFKNWTAIPGRVWHDETPADVATLVARPFSPVHHTEPAIALTLECTQSQVSSTLARRLLSRTSPTLDRLHSQCTIDSIALLSTTSAPPTHYWPTQAEVLDCRKRFNMDAPKHVAAPRALIVAGVAAAGKSSIVPKVSRSTSLCQPATTLNQRTAALSSSQTAYGSIRNTVTVYSSTEPAYDSTQQH